MSILHQQYLNIKARKAQIHHEKVIKLKHTFLAGQQTAAGVLQASDLYYCIRNIAFTFNSRTSNS
jgi:4'-phosphopantetheinyl transferase EntD